MFVGLWALRVIIRLPVDHGVAWLRVDDIGAIVAGPRAKGKGPGKTSVIYTAWHPEGLLIEECPAKLGQRWRDALEEIAAQEWASAAEEIAAGAEDEGSED